MIGFKKMLNITKENEKRLKFDVTETGLNDRSEAEKKAEGSGPLWWQRKRFPDAEGAITRNLPF